LEGIEVQTAIDQATPNILLAAAGRACCIPAEALAWLRDLADLAEENDPDARRCLPRAIAHCLTVLESQGYPDEQ